MSLPSNSPQKSATVLHRLNIFIGEQQTRLVLSVSGQEEQIFNIEIGVYKTGHAYFRHDPPTPAELENAISVIEDEVMPLTKLIPTGTRLYSTDPDIRKIAIISGLPNPQDKLDLSIDTVEETFNRLVNLSLGRPASQDSLPTDAAFSARLLILRELMHHLHFDKIICT